VLYCQKYTLADCFFSDFAHWVLRWCTYKLAVYLCEWFFGWNTRKHLWRWNFAAKCE